MAQNWNYAELSKAAKAAGGPEKFVELLETASKEAGKMEMLPWFGVAVVSTSLLTAITMKAIDFFKSKRMVSQKEVTLAKEEIIKGIKEYDETHNAEGGDENANVSKLR